MMRADQIQRLKDLEEKLAEVVLEEADPDLWPGAGVPLADMTHDQRGSRYWAKKNAAASFALLDRTISMARDAEAVNPLTGNHNPRPDLDKEINDAEKKAAKMLEAIAEKAKTAGR
jgi:hypothetical protein